ncbi:MAG: DUF6055 domain-containing protein, partial [Myxococcota bacterium]
MDCLLPDVLDALSGGPPLEARMVDAPEGFGRSRPGYERPGTGRKGVYGESLPFRLDGENFTVQWSDASVDPARAADILATLESAWTVLVEEERWPAPVSSDDWLLWVILDPTLGGSGYTTVYATDEFPEGYPVSFVNPAYDPEDPAFGLSVAVHEFGHMLQYKLRDWQLGRGDSWYWEATSEWIAERAAPTLDTYAESTFWYAQWPDARFDTLERWHPYGMLLLNAWLDERAVGFQGIRDVWLAAAGNERPWDELVAEVTGRDFGEIVAEMATEVAARTLRESPIYDVPAREASHERAPAWEVLELPGLYGSYFLDIGDGAIEVRGPVLTRFVQDGRVLDEAPVAGPYTAVITAIGEDGELEYGTTPPAEDADGPGACG